MWLANPLLSHFSRFQFESLGIDVGSDPNPAWNLNDERNVQFVVALFGFHLVMNVIVMIVGYLAVYFMMRVSCRRQDWSQSEPLLQQSDDHD
jgi:hypothetical protein